ncbi:hypothetical protein EV189_1678 [Motilibacter rhizosphaerae]|uniref:Uncharacterized protein n=1 Tax=Motilibacter rhizosphaerae TaxID=598652 RepID=A0A4V2F4N1_9ACTN|nr:hypothetical protein [Motilibacter rhizosphaerae]RZS89899.1 hypothetical protein EV189_1678 [Motilibacter rhizosphaerae]
MASGCATRAGRPTKASDHVPAPDAEIGIRALQVPSVVLPDVSRSGARRYCGAPPSGSGLLTCTQGHSMTGSKSLLSKKLLPVGTPPGSVRWAVTVR